MPQHRQSEFLKFMPRIEQETSQNIDIHLIVDNYGTHKALQVKDWLEKHVLLTTKCIRQGVCHNAEQLKATNPDFLEYHNKNPKTFVWTKDTNAILQNINKCKEALGATHLCLNITEANVTYGRDTTSHIHPDKSSVAEQ